MLDGKNPLAIDGLDANEMNQLVHTSGFANYHLWLRTHINNAIGHLLECNMGTDPGIIRAARMQERVYLLKTIAEAPMKAMEFKADDERDRIVAGIDKDAIRDGNKTGKIRKPEPESVAPIERGL